MPIRTLRELTPGDAVVVIEAAVLAVLFRTAVIFVSAARLISRASGRTTRGSAMPHEHVTRIAFIADRVGARILGADSCLVRSLVVLWMLRRRGASVTLTIGARRSPSGLDAHAWLALDGSPLLAGSDAGYIPLWESGRA